MSLVLLVRHAHSEANEKAILSGRLPGVFLSQSGLHQADGLSQRLGDIRVRAIHVSPLERCQQTIAPWLRDFAITTTVATVADFIEVDYGKWSGRKLATLSREPLWKTVQSKPSAVVFPGGESMTQMQTRTSSALNSLVQSTGTGVSIVVSHGDVIKSLITTALGLHLDEFQRFVIDPASISILDFSVAKTRLLLMNDSTTHIGEIVKSKTRRRHFVGGGSGLKGSK